MDQFFYVLNQWQVWVDLNAPTSTSASIGSGDSREPYGPSYDPDKYQWSPDIAGEFDGGGFMVQVPFLKGPGPF